VLLASTSDKIRLTTLTNGINVDVHASYSDQNGSTITFSRLNTLIATNTTTDVVLAPASSTVRKVKLLTVRNRDASLAQDVTVIHTDGTTAIELIKVTLSAGDVLHFDERRGFRVLDSQGRLKMRADQVIPASSPSYTIVTLGSDQTNNNAVANTIADVTGLSFAVTSGNRYWFRFLIMFTAAATTTGSRWSINGPALTSLLYKSEYSLTTSSRTINEGLSAYDNPAASNATSAATTANHAWIEGLIVPSANGTVIARFASEVAGSAIVAKAGSVLHWMQV
jgi:hypothetical protein